MTTDLDLDLGFHPLVGELRVVSDKSISHRALMFASLCDGRSKIVNLSTGQDVAHSAQALRELGIRVHSELVDGGSFVEPAAELDVGNSGTCFRLMMGLVSSCGFPVTFYGDESISRRPMQRVAKPLELMGASVSGTGDLCLAPVTVMGTDLRGIDYELEIASAQIKAAILLAGLNAAGTTSVVESVQTRMHTEELLTLTKANWGFEGALVQDRRDTDVQDGRLRTWVRRSELQPFELEVPSDPSQAAFFVVAALIIPGSDLLLRDVYLGPGRGEYLQVLQRMGADIELQNLRPFVSGFARSKIVDIRVKHCPLQSTVVQGSEVAGLIDEVPILAVAAAFASGFTEFRDAQELKVKESNRIATTAHLMQGLGASCEVRDDGLAVRGPVALDGRDVVVDSHGDHRIAMAALVGAMALGARAQIAGFESVATSYPGFVDDVLRVHRRPE